MTAGNSQPPIGVIEGSMATANELFWVDLAQDQLRKQLPFLNDVLHKLVTLNASILGGGLLLFKDDIAPAWSRVTTMTVFLVAFVACLWGMIPVSHKIYSECPQEIEDSENRARRWKWGCIRFTFFLMACAFAVAILGIICRTIQNGTF